jgi:hypothetical protein
MNLIEQFFFQKYASININEMYYENVQLIIINKNDRLELPCQKFS